MEKFYNFFADAFPQLFGFVRQAIPALADAAAIVRYVVLIAGLALAAFAVVALVIGCFKIRFFRRLARVLLVIETLGAVGLVLIAAFTVKTGNIPADMVKALELGSPAVFDLIKAIFSNFGVDAVPGFIIMIVAFVVIAVILHLIIVLSRIIVKRAAAKDRDDDAPDALPAEEEIAEPAPAASPAPVVVSETPAPAEEPIVPADVPEQEMETVSEPEASEEPAEEEIAEEEIAEETAEEETAEENEVDEIGSDEEIADEESAENEIAPIPDYVKLDQPAFMPIPSSVSDTVDFTDPKRDGFTLNPGVYAAAADQLISDEAAEDLTVVVYRKVEGKVAELPIDALNANFKPYSYVDAKILRQKGLIPESAGEVKITAHGKLDKPLMVQASAFAPGAAKMIILAGGRPIQVL
ncbi:MAG: uL15 family ribosomal protein [Clostridia bacterium]|nr:uL15 family ribosomal protein [Clostridia bacterium]